MSDLIEETADTTDVDGQVVVSIDDNKNKSYDPETVTPDAENNIQITLLSTGTKQWTFKANPITITNGADFTPQVQPGGTVLNVYDDEADRHQIPTHQYTCHVKSNQGDELDFDPVIRDRPTPPEL